VRDDDDDDDHDDHALVMMSYVAHVELCTDVNHSPIHRSLSV